MRARRAAALALAALLALAVLLASCGGDDEPQPERSRAAPAREQAQERPGPITAEDVEEHLRALQEIADRSDGTRAAGTDGDRRTADYVAATLREAGWRVRLEPVRFPYFEQDDPPRVGDLEAGEDVRVLAYSPPGTIEQGRVRAFDALGCRAAELGDLDPTDVVVLPRGTCTFATKARAVQRAGGGALVIADRGADTPVRGSLGRPGATRIPVLAATGEAAARLARRDRVDLAVDTVSERRTTRNVIADSRPQAEAGRIVMAGAHLDSVAEGPGLNDNGSGVAALLEVAERLAGVPGLRLGFWGAEEVGLYGSRRHVARLDAEERRRLAAYVNLDMVGSPNARRQVYDTDDRIERVLRAALPGDEAETDLGGASDQAPFARAGIPVGGLFAGAGERVDGEPADPCYHRRCDDLDNVDAEQAAAFARAARRALLRLRRPGGS